MKSIFTLIGLICFLNVAAQKFEVGIVGGASNTTRVRQSAYTGDEGKWNFATGLNFHYNINPHLQAGLDVGMSRWERTTNWDLQGYNDQSLGSKEVNYLLADRAFNVSFRINYLIPFYSRYEDFVRSSFYFGLSGGGIVTGSNEEITYSRSNPNTPAEYRYVSKYEYGSGYGTTLGAQAGFSYFFSKLIGINLEFAPKMAWVKVIDSKYGYANDTYNLIYFPTTIGLRFRFGDINY